MHKTNISRREINAKLKTRNKRTQKEKNNFMNIVNIINNSFKAKYNLSLQKIKKEYNSFEMLFQTLAYCILGNNKKRLKNKGGRQISGDNIDELRFKIECV